MKMIFAMRNKKRSLKIYQKDNGEYIAIQKIYLLGKFAIRTLKEVIKDYDDVQERIQSFKSATMYEDFYTGFKK